VFPFHLPERPEGTITDMLSVGQMQESMAGLLSTRVPCLG